LQEEGRRVELLKMGKKTFLDKKTVVRAKMFRRALLDAWGR
jgi:hypothetical protein